MAKVIAVVGLQREAAVLRQLDVVTLAGGGDPGRLTDELAQAAADADGIISFGMAGALDARLEIGDWVIGERVGQLLCSARWIDAIAHRLPAARIGPIHADGRLVASSFDKAELNRSFGALAADMESHLVAAVAAQAGLPFAVLRCVSDEASAALPSAIEVAMKPGGGLALGAVLGSLLRRPGQVPALARSVAGFTRAYGALRTGAGQVGRHLAYPAP